MGGGLVSTGLPAAATLRFRRRHEAFEKCLERKSPWPEAEVNVGLAHWKSGNRDAAGTAFEKALAADPNSSEAVRGLATLAMEREDYPKALELQARLIDRGERSPELFYNTGLLLHKSGQLEDAVRSSRLPRSGFLRPC
jgi:tetratricopeptide (TPR) repeat protein